MFPTDANLSVSLVVGLAGRFYIARRKRLRGYRTEDFDLLQEVLAGLSEVVLTPNVLTEPSNLRLQLANPDRSPIAVRFAEVVAVTPEIFVPGATACGHREFIAFGSTDVVLFEACEQGEVLLTVDVRLDRMVLPSRLPSINFHNKREFP